jgi:UDP-glucose 4-epimerase
MKILVTGGAGYIGSHMVKLLLQHDHDVTVLDDLSSGHRDALLTDDLVVDDIGSTKLDALFRSHSFDAVMHFAALIQVGESVRNPADYYRVNVAGTLNLLEAMRRNSVPRLIFSSTAAVYGNPVQLPLQEDHPKAPINPYGATKWMIEQAIDHYRAAYGLRAISLRYFNAAGADPAGLLGSRHAQETHLIPLLMQALSGRGGQLTVFGDDYDTHDGTCLRDYVHVSDLCDAHLLALEALDRAPSRPAYNLGSGTGCTVREAIDVAARVVGKRVPHTVLGRRAGDPSTLLADASAARRELGWLPARSHIETIVRDAWAWERHLCDLDRQPPAAISIESAARRFVLHPV